MVSVVIPTHNAGSILGNCLTALERQTVPRDQWEVLVVDDGSTDETEAVVRSFAATYLKVPHAGPAAARNQGLQAAQGEVVAFTDADCVPVPHWLEDLLAALAEPGVVGAKGAYRTQQRSLIARFAQLEYEEKYARMARFRYIDFVDTYSAAYLKKVVLEEGGFDTSFPQATGEDADLSFRLAERGYKMVFQPEAVVYHHHPDTLWAYWKRKFKQPYWRLQVYEQHPARMGSDSHTPQTLKLQLGLFLLGLVVVAAAAGRGPALGPAVVFALFVVSTLPFTLTAMRKDVTVGLMAPLLLGWRASAFAAGTLAGIVAWIGRKGNHQWRQIVQWIRTIAP